MATTREKETDYLEKAKLAFDLSYACKEELDSNQLQIYAQHLAECGAEVLGAHVLANSDSTNKYEFPKGQVIMYPADSKVTAATLQPGLYDHLVVQRIFATKEAKDEMTDAFFKAKLDRLNEAIPQTTDTPARLAYREDGGNKDIDYWTPSMGNHGWVSILKVRHKSGRDEDSQYFIAVKAGVPQAVEDFIGEFADEKKPKNISFEDLIRYDRDHAYLKKLGERNARRLAFRAAEAIGVRIHHTDDARAYTHPRNQEAKPMMAITRDGDFCQPLTSLELVQHPSPLFVKPVAAVMSMSVNPDKTREQCLVMVNPYEGIVGLKMDPKYKGKQAIQVKSVALPVCTGRKTAPDQVKTTGRDMKKYLKGVTWEQKNGEINDKIAPESYRSFEGEGDEFVQKLAASGWNPSWGSVHYVPVVSKIANRKLA